LTRNQLKGSIAGIYSLSGGFGILLLTKLGGYLFDNVDPGSPFFIMAGFNALLLLVGSFLALLNGIRKDDDNDALGESDELENENVTNEETT